MAIRQQGASGLGQGPAVAARPEWLEQERWLGPRLRGGKVIPEGPIQFLLQGHNVRSCPETSPFRDLAGHFGPMEGAAVPVEGIKDVGERGPTSLYRCGCAAPAIGGKLNDRHDSPPDGDRRALLR